MSIPPIDRAVREYLLRFDLAAIARTRDGRIVSTRDPEGHEQAWWCRAVDVGRVLKRARGDGDVPAAAAALGVELAEHSATVQRTQRLLAKLDQRVMQAQNSGALGVFNQEYRRRRLEAQALGRSFPSYPVMRLRLKAALVGATISDASTLMMRVFGS